MADAGDYKRNKNFKPKGAPENHGSEELQRACQEYIALLGRSQCDNCKNLIKLAECKASKRIPLDIDANTILHTKPLPDQGYDIIFEAK